MKTDFFPFQSFFMAIHPTSVEEPNSRTASFIFSGYSNINDPSTIFSEPALIRSSICFKVLMPLPQRKVCMLLLQPLLLIPMKSVVLFLKPEYPEK